MPRSVFTIGHSNHSSEHFRALLLLHGITAVCDVRSSPYSRFNPHFNREQLAASLAARAVAYVFLGNELGARCEDPSCYRDGKVIYDRLANTQQFRLGLARVEKGAATHRLALMCAEKDPIECHRAILVARHLTANGLDVHHIHADGALETHAEAMTRLRQSLHLPERDLFRSEEDFIADSYRLQEERIAFELEPVAG